MFTEPDAIEKNIEIRKEALKRGDNVTAERIRTGLKETGITLVDTPGGTSWHRV